MESDKGSRASGASSILLQIISLLLPLSYLRLWVSASLQPTSVCSCVRAKSKDRGAVVVPGTRAVQGFRVQFLRGPGL